MNNDLISREALKETINSSIAEATKIGIMVDADYLWELLNYAIDNAPTVEVGYLTNCANCERVEIIRSKRPQGEWVERSNRYDSYSHRMVFKCECNQCQMCEEFPQDDETGNILLSHYCPNCGADMWKV